MDGVVNPARGVQQRVREFERKIPAWRVQPPTVVLDVRLEVRETESAEGVAETP